MQIVQQTTRRRLVTLGAGKFNMLDQSGILAQKFHACGKLRTEFFSRAYDSEPEACSLSSVQSITAARLVQFAVSGNAERLE
ncbi:MAG: hypothetical protein DMG90_17130 [Acidobacteria bacterium]|nr:MAG: hypothetical protein DMG91_01035 [Acidobacteriota bacterium]PYV87663.1 MAG: hypothetical protein DMG90_17130 [Acidobacteriota bacterium]